MKDFKKYIIGYTLGLMSVRIVGYAANSGSIGELFNQVTDSNGSITSNWRLDGKNIQDNTITSSEIQDNTITSSDILDNSVNTSKIADNSITTIKIQDGQVTTGDIANNSVNSAKIFDGSIVSSDIQDLGITSNDLGNDSVIETKIMNGSVTLSKLGNDSVNSAKIVDGSITMTDLQTNSVGTSKIIDNSIMSSDIYDGEITNQDLADNSINQGKVQNGYVDLSSTQTISGLKRFNIIRSNQFLYTSDKRFKDNIKTIESPLNKVLNLRGVSWNWKKDGKKDMGFIAQEVEEIIPELVNTDASGYKSVQYGNIVGLLVEGIKEQQKQIELLEQKIQNLENNR